MDTQRVTVNTQERIIRVDNFEFKYGADDFVNADSYDFHHGVWTGHDPKAWIIHDAGYVKAIVFSEYYAYCDQDALDEAADSGKLDGLQVTASELADYETGKDSDGNPEYEGIIHLGNASEPFASESLEMFSLPATMFAGDPVIIDVMAKDSRNMAIEEILWKASEETEEMDGYHIVQRAIDYLRLDI